MKYLLSLIFLFGVSRASAAACCGGGISMPALILGDQQAQLSASFTETSLSDDVDDKGQWRKRHDGEVMRTLRLDAAQILSDRTQWGLSVPVVRRSRGDEASSGLGDVSATVGYEFLTDWDYNPWRPKGVGFLSLTVPTGRDIRDAQTLTQIDSRGRGFWALGAGTAFVKVFGRWDANASLELHRAFSKRDRSNNGTVEPGWGGMSSLGIGYSRKSWRYGGSLAWFYEDPVDARGTINSNGTEQRWATAAISAGRQLDNEWALSFLYSDQTIMGSPVNTSLGQSVAIQISKGWLR